VLALARAVLARDEAEVRPDLLCGPESGGVVDGGGKRRGRDRPDPGAVQSRLTTSSSLTIFSSSASASAVCRLSIRKLSKSGAVAAITCAGRLAASTRAIKLFEPPVAMRQPSRRASAPISEMYFERVRTSVDLIRSCALIFRCLSDVRCAWR
jgi:hypothetical protein